VMEIQIAFLVFALIWAYCADQDIIDRHDF
jgi:hypothetical protein